ncbi:MAG TPA: hypothetical protein VFE31_14035 [Opitutaceae bacterium]|jgi:hypothetical protein|nr:hypothetical protein [Opitutaceae bacterium]
MSRFIWLLGSALVLGFTAGCQAPGMGGIALNAEISGGSKVEIPINRHGAIKAENDDLRVTDATLIADFKVRLCCYAFGFQEKHPFGLRRVMVEDVTDDQPVVMIDDRHPRLVGNHYWRAVTPRFTPTPDNIHWLMEVDYNMRIYRFTIVKDDGQTEVLYDGQDYGNPVKEYIRIGMGLEKLPPRR